MGRHGNNRISPRAIEIAERRKRSLELFKEGLPLRDIAAQVGVSYEMVRRDIDFQIAAIPSAAREDARAAKLAELAALKNSWAAKAATLIPAAQMVLRIIERECKILGLDAAQQIEVAGMPAANVVVRFGDEKDSPAPGSVD